METYMGTMFRINFWNENLGESSNQMWESLWALFWEIVVKILYEYDIVIQLFWERIFIPLSWNIVG